VTYFNQEYGHETAGMNFSGLLQRLLDRLKKQVHNGELTERSLARRVGLSQSHIHNVLKGARILTPNTADRILRELKISLLDLIEVEDPASGTDFGAGRSSRGPGEVSLAGRVVQTGIPLRKSP
jgi:transcriptional regulator with XRE-family HTH domain